MIVNLDEIGYLEWWEFKCPDCGSECVRLPLATTDEVESQYCQKCGKVVATRKLKHKGDLGYLTSYNLIVMAKMRLQETIRRTQEIESLTEVPETC